MSPLHFHVKEHVIPGQYIREYPGALMNNQEDTLYLHIKQYKPKDESHNRPGAVTIIGAHANAFPKELYEPFWDELFQALKERGQAIKSIWIADIATEGKSGEINENKLGNDASWNDHPRDMLHMINHFRAEMPRPLVGIGHSMGASHLCQVAYNHPRLLSTVILIDPVISFTSTDAAHPKIDAGFARNSTFRRDLWPSRAQAIASFKKSKFYQTWDPRVLDLWFEYGLRDLPTAIYPEIPDNTKDPNPSETPVTLTTSKHQEVFMFVRPNFNPQNHPINRLTHPDLDPTAHETNPLFYRPEPPAVFKQLPHLRPSALYIFGGTSDISQPEQRKQKLERTGTGVGGSGGVAEGRVEEVVVEGVGHLVPMIVPKASAVRSAGFLARELERWRGVEEEWRRGWEGKGRLERITVSEEWKRNVGGDPRAKPSQKL